MCFQSVPLIFLSSVYIYAWSGSQGDRAASPTCPASGETQWVGWRPLLVREGGGVGQAG